jgi:hypothetical protein
MMSRGYDYLLLLGRAGQVGRSVEHSKEKDEESALAIPRFLCGSPRPCWLRTAPFWPRWQAFSCVLTTCRVFIGSDKPSSFYNYLVEPHIPALCGAFTFGVRMRLRAKTSSREQGPDFNWVGTCEWLSCMRAFESQAYGVFGQVLSLQCVYRFESPRHSRLWVITCHCGHLIVYLVYCCEFKDLDRDIVMIILLLRLLHLLTFDIDMGQRSICLCLF